MKKLLLLAISFIFFSCFGDDKVTGSDSGTETGVISGQLVLSGGEAAPEAFVAITGVVDIGDVSLKKMGYQNLSQNNTSDTLIDYDIIDTIKTDSEGRYVTDTLLPGTYSLFFMLVLNGDTLVSSRTSIKFEVTIDLGIDTLWGPGSITSNVQYENNPIVNATCMVEILMIQALTNEFGICTISPLPAGNFDVTYLVEGFVDTIKQNVYVEKGRETNIGLVNLLPDLNIIRQIPSELSINLDTNSGTIKLQWMGVNGSGLKQYILIKKDRLHGDIEEIILNISNPGPNVYSDTITIFNVDTITVFSFEYSLQIEFINGDTSEPIYFDTVTYWESGNTGMIPTILGVMSTSNSIYKEESVQFIITAHDPDGSVDRYYWSLDSNNFTDSTDVGFFNTTFIDTGFQSIFVKVRDNDGNFSETYNQMVWVHDTAFGIWTSPDTTILIGDSITLFAHSVNPYDSIVEVYWIKMWEQKVKIGSEFHSISFPDTGLYVIPVYAINEQGHKSKEDTIKVWVVDSLPDTTSFRVIPFETEIRGAFNTSYLIGVNTEGIGPFSFEWFRNGTSIPGADSQSFFISSFSPSDTGFYSVRVSDGIDTIFSDNIHMYIYSNGGSQVTLYPNMVDTVALGDTIKFFIQLFNIYPTSYEWVINDSAVAMGTDSTFNAVFLDTSISTYFINCIAKSSQRSDTSNTVRIQLGKQMQTINDSLAPMILNFLPDDTVSRSDSVLYQITASGARPLFYQWQKNDSDVVGANDSTFFATFTNVAIRRDSFRCIVSNAYGIDTSNTAGLFFKENGIINSFIDPRDGKTYEKIIIGSQTWMAENLNYASLSNSYCYNDSSIYCESYGRLYKWGPARSICPSGWHLPDNSEWETLFQLVADSTGDSSKIMNIWAEVGKHLKAVKGWGDSTNTLNLNSFGFKALPGGLRGLNGNYLNGALEGHWWSDNEAGPEIAWDLPLILYSDRVLISTSVKENAASVRCIMD